MTTLGEYRAEQRARRRRAFAAALRSRTRRRAAYGLDPTPLGKTRVGLNENATRVVEDRAA